MTDGPGHLRERRSLYLQPLAARCGPVSRPHQAAAAQIPSPPGTDKTPPSQRDLAVSLLRWSVAFPWPAACPASSGRRRAAFGTLFPSAAWAAARAVAAGRSSGFAGPYRCSEREPPWQRPAGLRVQPRFIHSAPYDVSTPTNASARCGCTSCASHPLPLISCQLASRPPSPTARVARMAA